MEIRIPGDSVKLERSSSLKVQLLGKGGATKSDEFSEKIQTAFDLQPSFWKIILQFFSENVQKKPLKVQNLQN